MTRKQTLVLRLAKINASRKAYLHPKLNIGIAPNFHPKRQTASMFDDAFQAMSLTPGPWHYVAKHRLPK